MTSDNSKGFCIFYDWLEVFGLLDKEDVADLVFAIGKYYVEGADILDSVSDRAKPVAVMIVKQIERARAKKAAKIAYFNAKAEKKTKTETDTKTDTETKTETETEKIKKQHKICARVREVGCIRLVAGGGCRNTFFFPIGKGKAPAQQGLKDV